MQVKLSERITLSDEVPESSYGQPVAIIGDKAYGRADVVEEDGHAGELVQAKAIQAHVHGDITTDDLEWCSRFWK